MAVYVYNLTINQGADFSLVFDVEGSQTNAPKDLSGYSASAQLKKTYSSSSAVSFASTISDPEQGVIQISMDASVTSGIKPGRYVYDVKVSSNLETLRVIEGTVLVRAGVTTT